MDEWDAYESEGGRLRGASELIWRTRKPAGTTKLPRQVATWRKKHSKGVAYESKSARTRTSLIGVTIYQPDVEPSAKGRRLLDALNSIYQCQKSLEI